MTIESKNVFFILASFLIFIIILSMLGILAPNDYDYSKEVIVNTIREDMYYPPVYYGGPYRKNNVYAPNVFMGRGPYIRRYY
jgi:hypothetical protein